MTAAHILNSQGWGEAAPVAFSVIHLVDQPKIHYCFRLVYSLAPLLVAAYKRCQHPRLFLLAGVLITSLATILASCATTKSVVIIAFAIAGKSF